MTQRARRIPNPPKHRASGSLGRTFSTRFDVDSEDKPILANVTVPTASPRMPLPTLAEFAGVVSTNQGQTSTLLLRPKDGVPTRIGRRPMTPHTRGSRRPNIIACHSPTDTSAATGFVSNANRNSNGHDDSPRHEALPFTGPHCDVTVRANSIQRCTNHTLRRTLSKTSVEGDRCHKGGGDQPVVRDRPAVDSSPAEQFLHLAARRFTK